MGEWMDELTDEYMYDQTNTLSRSWDGRIYE